MDKHDFMGPIGRPNLDPTDIDGTGQSGPEHHRNSKYHKNQLDVMVATTLWQNQNIDIQR